MFRITGSLFVMVLFTIVFAFSSYAGVKMEELTADPVFKQMTPEQKLEKINIMIGSKELDSTSSRTHYVHRLLWEILIAEKSAKDQIEKYAVLKTKYTKLPVIYELERFLIMDYLMTDAEMSKASLKDQLAKLEELVKTKKISWPGIAPLQQGILYYYLLTNAEFKGQSLPDRIATVSLLESQGVTSNMVGAPVKQGLVMKAITAYPADQRQAKAQELLPKVGFFTESLIKDAYLK